MMMDFKSVVKMLANRIVCVTVPSLCGKYPGLSKDIKKENTLEASVCASIAQLVQTATAT
jgi:hypothetical protein